MTIRNFRVSTCMGKVNTYFGHPLTFLSDEEKRNLDEIGYTGKLNGEKTSRVEYLNSLNKGSFQVDQIKFDNGDLSEEFVITRVTQ